MKLLQTDELRDIRQTMLTTAQLNEPFRLAFMTEKYAEELTHLIGGQNKEIDSKIKILVSKLNNIARETRHGELEVGHSFYLSTSYIDTFIDRVLIPWVRAMYGEDFISQTVFKNTMVGDA